MQRQTRKEYLPLLVPDGKIIAFPAQSSTVGKYPQEWAVAFMRKAAAQGTRFGKASVNQ
jgi:hypothetical protein